jgi:hypothetical protein
MASPGQLDVMLRPSNPVGEASRAREASFETQNCGVVVGLGIDDDIAVSTDATYGPEAESAAISSERAVATALPSPATRREMGRTGG